MAGTASSPAADFVLTERDFQWMRRAASEYSGIMLPEAKRKMIYGRLTKRLRTLGMRSFSEYRKLLEDTNSNEFPEFINALTTNLTAFFREPYHFEHLTQTALPEVMAARERRGKARRLRIWSAGCSTGQEPYTILMAIREGLPQARSWELRVIATDLDTQALARARRGEYPQETVRDLDEGLVRRWFLRGSGAFAGQVKVRPELSAAVEFQQFNLVRPWSRPWGEPIDVIFCRNVVIYFDKATQVELFQRFADTMAPGGFLYQGHSETLFQINDRFQPVGRTVYQLPEGK